MYFRTLISKKYGINNRPCKEFEIINQNILEKFQKDLCIFL